MDLTPYTGDLDLSSVTARQDLSALLRTVHLRADRPSLRALEARSRHSSVPLSKTVVSDMLKGTRFPRKAVMLAFLEACGVHGGDLEAWQRAWERVAGSDQGPAEPRPAAALDRDRDRDIIPSGRPDDRQGANSAAHAAYGAIADAGLARSASSKMAERAGRGLSPEEVSRPHSASERQSPPAAASERSVRKEYPATDPAVPGPTVRRRELGILLRTLRAEKGITVEQAAEHLLCSPGKISRIEADFRAGTLRDVRDLCALYGVPEGPQRDHLMSLARESKQQGWWQSYELPYSTYVGLENGAVSVKQHEVTLIPGLLQTADYTRALNVNGLPKMSPERAEQQVQTRLKRQVVLTRADPVRFSVVVGEGALRQSVGGPAVMRAQLDHLIKVSALPNVTLQILPFSAGALPNLSSSAFSVMGFNSPVPDMVYTEGLFGFIYLERPSDVERYQAAFEALSEAALNEEDSGNFIAEIIREVHGTG